MTFHRDLLRMCFTLWLMPAAGTMLQAQIVDNRLGMAFREEMYFNQQFLWQNRIQTITGTIGIKRPGKPIDQRPDVFVYHFNEVGLLTRFDKVSSVFDLVDSLRIEYKFNDLGAAELRSERSSKGFFITRYNYDKEGRIVRIDYEKAENISGQKNKLEPGQTTIINSETINYSDTGPTFSRKSNYNNYGLLYSNQHITRNDLGYVLSDSEELVMSGRTTTRNYTYDERGWVKQVETTDNQGMVPRREVFYYDLIGNLLKVEFYKGQELREETEVLYTPTMLIEALLHHDLQSHEIVITKFAYEFYK